MTNREKFQNAYVLALTKAVQKHPEEYAYGMSEVPTVAASMTKALAENRATLGPAAKSAARACKISPTLKSVHAFLNEESST